MIVAVLPVARPEEARLLDAQFPTLPLLPKPADLWQQAIELGQACRRIGSTFLSLDLLVAAVALHHNAELVNVDADFDAIASVSALRLHRLTRSVCRRDLPPRQMSQDAVRGKAFRIGHSYLTPSHSLDGRSCRDWFAEVVATKLRPLLHEYWFDASDVAEREADCLLEEW